MATVMYMIFTGWAKSLHSFPAALDQ